MNLIQGNLFNQKLFNKTQKSNAKFKNYMYEGFTNNTSSNDLDDINKLHIEFSDLMAQYNIIQKDIHNKSTDAINRISTNNPYLNKIIRFSNDETFYVTNKGIAKYIPSTEILKTINAPTININIPWNDILRNPGNIIQTKPTLITGTPLILGQTLRNEGLNIFATNIINNPTTSYIGCYNDNKTEIITELGYTTFNKCQNYAINNSYQYFGFQNYKPDGTAQCIVSNDLIDLTNNGNANIITKPIPIWTSNTSNGEQNIAQLQGTGQIVITKTDGTIISQINSGVSDCNNWGTILVDSATFGGNTGNSIGNITNKISYCNYKNNCTIPISASGFELTHDSLRPNSIVDDKSTINDTISQPNTQIKLSDLTRLDRSNKQLNPPNSKNNIEGFTNSFTSNFKPAFDIVYKCGDSTPISKRLNNAEGQTMILDCNNYIQTTCQFYLLLEDNGNMVIVKGKDTSENKGVIWSSDTTNKNIDINSEWIASKGKYGRNYLKMGETLAMGEWIGSSNGSTKLIMELDGNLVLYAAKNSDGCKKFNDKILGGSNINSVYKLNEKGNINNLGKIGYVDHNSTLREYPKSMINFSNTYQTYKHTNSPGNDIKSIITTDQTDCEQSCNNTSDCAGYVYQSDNKTCVLKKENNFIKETNNNFTLGVRDKSLINNSSCSNQMINVDTLEYSNYIKGDDMNSDINCSESIMNPEININ